MFSDMNLVDTGARGRNGWFRADVVEFWVEPDKLEMSVYSQKRGKMPPIALQMDKQDARNLALGILAAIGEEPASPDKED